MHRRAISSGIIFSFLIIALPVARPALAATELSGTVTGEEDGLPIEGVVVGVTREETASGIPADEAIPVEWTSITDANGEYTFVLDESLSGMDRLHVFTYQETVFNELWGGFDNPGIDTRGMAPKRRDLEEAGVVTIDLTGGAVTGIDFVVASSRSLEMVLMRDGVTRLATDYWLPSRRPGMSWPVLLQRLPYSRGTPPRSFTSADYAVVIQNTRGRYDSEGVNNVFDDDGWLENQDGYDTVEWAAAQAWSNGKVGTFGASAHGITQYLLAGAAPPSLVCSVAEIASGNFYQDMTYPGGIFRKHMVENWLAGQDASEKLNEYWDHPNLDSYWDERNLLLRADQVVVPILHIGGWYDIFTLGTLDAFRVLHTSGGEGARRNQKLVMGPWIHGLYVSPFQGELWYPEVSLFLDYDTTRMRWFNFWMKGEDTGIMDDPPARTYVMGPGLPEGSSAPGNFWRSSDSWPPPSIETSYYLHPGGLLSTDAPTVASAETTYIADPADPVPTLGGNNLYDDIGQGPFDQRPVDDVRADVVVWQSAPLTAAVEASGPIRFELFASSDRTDTDWIVKLEDVYPDGRAMLVMDLGLMARHRISLRQEDLLTPGQIYRFEIMLWDTSITFPAGHRIRVALSSANYPRFEVNPQSGEPFKKETRTEIATNRIQHSADYPSRLILSVTDPTALQGCRPTAVVTDLQMSKVAGEEVQLEWIASTDPCHRRYRIFAGIEGPQWPQIVRRPVAETTETTLRSIDPGIFWQVVSEGTDGGNGPHGSP